MEHSYIEEHNIADRYLLGQLLVKERTQFEEHCENCMQCSNRLEAIDGLRTGLWIVAGEEVWRLRDNVKVGMLARVARLSRASRTILFAGAILLITLLVGAPILEWGRARRDRAQTALSVAEWRRKYEEREQAAQDLKKEIIEMEARDRQHSAQQDRLTTRSVGKREDRTRMADAAGKATFSQAVVPVFALSVMRDDGPELSRPSNQITLSPLSKLMVLLLELGPDTDFQSYRVAISTTDGRSVWRESQLKPSSNYALALSFNSSLFKPDNYMLTFEGLTAQKRYVLIGRYAFHVLNE
jgi:hypothetical protein